jgi:hypothetical protein
MEGRYIIIRDEYASIYVDIDANGMPMYRMVTRQVSGDNSRRVIGLPEDVKELLNKHAPFDKRVTFYIPGVYTEASEGNDFINVVPEKISILKKNKWITVSSTFNDKFHILITKDFFSLHIIRLDTQYDNTDPRILKSTIGFILADDPPLYNSLRMDNDGKISIHYVKIGSDNLIDTSTKAILSYELDNLIIKKNGVEITKFNNLVTVADLNKKF